MLAFADMSPQKDQEWFSDGITEEILNSLANLPELKVTARTSSFYFKGKDVPLDEIANKLGVAHIVEGSVRKMENRLRITAQLIRASDGFHIWSQTYDRSTEDIFQVQTEIAESIAKTLLNELTPEKKSKLAVTKTASVEAYEYYLRGNKIHFDKYYPSGVEKYFKDAERNFLKAISLDPNYADAYGALADLYDSRSGHTTDQKQKMYRQRDSVALMGYQLDPNSLPTLRALFWSQMKTENPNYDSAFYYLQKAYQLNNEDTDVNRIVGNFYSWVGLPELAEKFAIKSLTIDPLDINNLMTLANLYGRNGNDDLLIKYSNKILEIDSNHVGIHRALLSMYVTNKKLDQAKGELEIIKRIKPDLSSTDFLEAVILAMQGKKEPALKKSNSDYIYLLLGMKKELLTKMKEWKVTSFAPNELQHRDYDFVRNEPDFKDFEERVKIDYRKRLVKYGTLE